MPPPPPPEDEPQAEEEEAPSGPISGCLPTVLDLAGILGGCECTGHTPPENAEGDAALWPSTCCQNKENHTIGENGEPVEPSGEKAGICKMIEAQISMALGPHIGFALGFEPILDVPPAPPSPPIPPSAELFGLPTFDVPTLPLPPVAGIPLPEIGSLDVPAGFFPEVPAIPTPDIPPFPGMAFLGLTIFPINFGIGLISLDPKIPIPSADPCSLIDPMGMPCNPALPGVPQLNLAICGLCILLFLLMIIMVLLVILAGMGIASVVQSLDEDGNPTGDPPKMLDKDGNEVAIPPPLIIGNPGDHRPSHEGDQPKINQFNVGARVTLIAKKFDLKNAFGSAEIFSVGPDEISDQGYEDPSGNNIRAGFDEGDEDEEGNPGPEEPNMRYDWKIYGPEELNSDDILSLISSMGFVTEDEVDENGNLVEGGARAGSYKPKTLDQRTPLWETTKTTAEDGAGARRITFGTDLAGNDFPIGDYEVICFATKMAGSEPDIQTARLQTIIRVGELDNGVWRTVKKPTELPAVLRAMDMPLRRTPLPITQEVEVNIIPAPPPIPFTPTEPISSPESDERVEPVVSPAQPAQRGRTY